MAAALLDALLSQRGLHWPVASAGVVGHDGDPAEPEARNAMIAFNLDISMHRARSLNDDLVATAALLLAIDNGVARVVRMRYPTARVVTLGEFAGRSRDIPDPFRMQIGAWLNYAREIDTLLRSGLDQLIAILQGASEAPPDSPPPAIAAPPADPPPPPANSERTAAIERCTRLLTLLGEMPHLVEWPNARRQLEAELKAISTLPLRPADLVLPYTTMLIGIFGISTGTPSSGQLSLLRNAIEQMRAPIAPQAIADLSAALTGWAELH